MLLDQVALELYTVRDETERDFTGTLRRIAEMGYPAVEFAGYGGLSAREMATLLKETGLKAASTHVRLPTLESDIEQEIDYCLEIGCSFLILPWLAPELRTPDAFRALATHLNEWGLRCKERGVTFGYHNHDFEFAQYEGKYLLDYLLDSTEPALVALELDVYWAAYAGVDPSAYIRQRSGRIPLIHVKDMTPDRNFTEVGDGILGLEKVMQVARDCGAQWFIVENDKPVLPSLESARRSLENLRRMQV
jgi:sugar phosphate isomerase/epimerase